MDFENTWNVVSKDFAIFKNKKSILYTLTILPLAVGIGFTIILLLIHDTSPSPYTTYIYAFIWFIILAAIIPTAVASYSVMGEKV